MAAYLLALADAPPSVALFAPALLVMMIAAIVAWRFRVDGAGCALIAAGLLFANWLLNTLHCYANSGAYDPLATASIDWGTGIALFPLMPRSRCAVGIVALFGLQLVAHAARFLIAWLELPAEAIADGPYYWTLSYTAWAQVAFLGAWIVGGGYRRWRNAVRRSPAPPTRVRAATRERLIP